LDSEGHPHFSAGEADPDHPGLWFTGYKVSLTGFFDAAIVAAERIADSILQQQTETRRTSDIRTVASLDHPVVE